MSYNVNYLNKLSDCFRSLPGIGERTAQRLAFHIMNMPQSKAEEFANAILNAKAHVHCCPICQNLTDMEICSICSDPKRDKSIICVVESPSDAIAIEKTAEFYGLYHVLHGVMSPIDNIGPADIKIKELIQRLSDESIKEIIIATNPTVEGDVTAAYLKKLLAPLGINVSRLAFGIPVGGDLEYTDKVTLTKALENRKTF